MISIDHRSNAGGDGEGDDGISVERTSGGNGFEREAMNAPTPAQASRTPIQSSAFAHPRTAP